MPKPIFGVNGSGMHCHQSLFNAGTSENAFYDADDEYGLSELAKQFIAGQLAHARGMTPILASLVNSYKRLVPGYEAPVYITWARANRSALIRVPKISKGKERSARIELRFPDPASNPYLAFAVMLQGRPRRHQARAAAAAAERGEPVPLHARAAGGNGRPAAAGLSGRRARRAGGRSRWSRRRWATRCTTASSRPSGPSGRSTPCRSRPGSWSGMPTV